MLPGVRLKVFKAGMLPVVWRGRKDTFLKSIVAEHTMLVVPVSILKERGGAQLSCHLTVKKS